MARIVRGRQARWEPKPKNKGRGRRRPRDALVAPRQDHINLAWMRATSARKHKPRRSISNTISALKDVLKDSALVSQLKSMATFRPREVPTSISTAVKEAAADVFGDVGVAVKCTGQDRNPVIVISPSESTVSKYDISDLEVRLEDSLSCASFKRIRRGIRISLAEPRATVTVMVHDSDFTPESSVSSFPLPLLTRSLDWVRADREGQELVQREDKLSWALALSHFLCVGSAKSSRTTEVLELVLRHLALRIQERDEPAFARREMLESLAQVQHQPGEQLFLTIARELLDWQHSALLRLWLKDAERGHGAEGRAKAEQMLSHAAQKMEAEIWGLLHTQFCPPSEDDSVESQVDRSITQGVRLIHLGSFEEAQQQLKQAQRTLTSDTQVKATCIRNLLMLAALLGTAVLYQRCGFLAASRRLSSRCTQDLQRLDFSCPVQPLSCWHNLPLLLRAMPRTPLVTRLDDGGDDSPWPNFEATGAVTLDGQGCTLSHRLSADALMEYLMPLTGKSLEKRNCLELSQVRKGLAVLFRGD